MIDFYFSITSVAFLAFNQSDFKFWMSRTVFDQEKKDFPVTLTTVIKLKVPASYFQPGLTDS